MRARAHGRDLEQIARSLEIVWERALQRCSPQLLRPRIVE
jgi:hypothetical protein